MNSQQPNNDIDEAEFEQARKMAELLTQVVVLSLSKISELF